MKACVMILAFLFALSTILVSGSCTPSLDRLSIVQRVENVKLSIRPNVDAQEQRNTTVLQDFTLFFGPIGQGVINVRSGLRASFNFDYRIHGVTSRFLAASDQLYRSTLNHHEQVLYENSKRMYEGGLSVPFLTEMGIDLNQSHSESAIQEAMSRVDNYSIKAIAARRIMESFQGSRLRINGSISAIGVSDTPSRAAVYVKVSRVTLIDEKVLHVVSSNTNDIIAGDGFYNELPVVNIDSDTTQEIGGNPFLP